MPKEDPETGFYNALAGTDLTVDRVEMNGATPTLYLRNFEFGRSCEVPRIEEQLKATLLQRRYNGRYLPQRRVAFRTCFLP